MRDRVEQERQRRAEVVLHWIPLGAGGHVVRRTGHLYELAAARRDRRPPLALFHTAVEVDLDGEHHALEMGPVWNVAAPDRGAAVQGPVGTRWLGRSRWFRYEVRSWRGGVIPDVAAAALTVVVGRDPGRAQRMLDLVPQAPALTWGRDELGLGEMWNSNALVSWLLGASGHDVDDLAPPAGGRAPGWHAGLALAARSAPSGPSEPPAPGSSNQVVPDPRGDPRT